MPRMMSQNRPSFRYPLGKGGLTLRSPISGAPARLCCDQELTCIAFANMLDYLNIENGRSSEYPGPITTICKNGLFASILLLYVFPTDKGDKAGVHPYNRIVARA